MTAIQKRYRPIVVTWDQFEEVWIVKEPDDNTVFVDTQTRARKEGMQVAKNASLKIGGSFQKVQLPGVAVWSMKGKFRIFDANVEWFEKALYRRSKPRLQKEHRPVNVGPDGSQWSVHDGTRKLWRPFSTKKAAMKEATKIVRESKRPGISIRKSDRSYDRFEEYDPYYANRWWMGK